MRRIQINRMCAVLVVALALLAQSAPAAGQTAFRLTVAPQGNEARYLVREQLARLEFPNDAIATTSGITGGIVVDAAGAVVAGESRFVIDLASLKSDSDRRDNYVRRNTLQTEQHPSAVFVPRQLQGLTQPLPAAGAVSFRMVGDLTIRGVTRPVVWDVDATVENGSIRGEAKTRFTFADFDLTKPRVASVLSVADEIRVEYTFFLVPQR